MTAVAYHDGRFPPSNLDWPRLIPLIGPANAAIARYAGLLQGVPDTEILLSPMTTQEAVLSSRIEGTQTTMGEVLTLEAEGGEPAEDTAKGADIQEVLNYRAGLREAERLLATMPLSQRLFREVHRVLMRGVRGRSKDPGEYRRIPNWIGPPGCTLKTARFVPVSPARLPAAMQTWERFLHDDPLDRLVQLALAHAEFEAIHPFLDGNGRLGRLVIPVFLFANGLLPRPCFYLSEHLERNRGEYFERLLAVSRDDDWTGWVAFFLRAVIDQAEVNQARIHAILTLYDRLKEWITEATGSKHGVRALDWMFSRPIFGTTAFRDSSRIPPATAMRILRVCRDHGMLVELRPGTGRRAAILCFSELLAIAEGRDAAP